MPVGREFAADDLHRRRVVVRQHVGANPRPAQPFHLAQFPDRNPRQERAVCPCDLGVGDIVPPVELPHRVACLVERQVAPLQPSDHLGGVAGVYQSGDPVHAELPECRCTALYVEVYEDAPEVENYIFNIFHSHLMSCPCAASAEFGSAVLLPASPRRRSPCLCRVLPGRTARFLRWLPASFRLIFGTSS